MRLCLLVVAIAGCHASSAAPAAGGLTVHLALATASTDSDVAIASVALRLGQLVAVSDRSDDDARAALGEIELGLGDTRDVTLPTAPPGIYSAIDAELGSANDEGLDVEGVWNSVRVHAQLATAPFDVGCPTPAALDPGQRVALTVSADPASWFDGLDLGSAVSDADDNGIVIGDDDNHPMDQLLLANVIASFTLDCSID
jgi:hypothetical protein